MEFILIISHGSIFLITKLHIGLKKPGLAWSGKAKNSRIYVAGVIDPAILNITIDQKQSIFR
jgi:hypothetical protein